jgi:hypothetical protein
MRRQFQIPSKILHRLERERENQRLYMELNCIKPTMSISLPRELSHLKVNKKRDQIREGIHYSDRYTEIERENRLLLEKIQNIKNCRVPRVDVPYIKQSLNYSLRTRNQRQISIDNLSLLERIQSKRSFYDFGKVNSDRKAGKSTKQYGIIPSFSKNHREFWPEKSRNVSPMPTKEKTKVFNMKIKLAGSLFSVDIYKKNSQVKIIAINEETKEKYILKLKMKEALTLMYGSLNWSRLVDCLHLEDGELALYDESSSELL